MKTITRDWDWWAYLFRVKHRQKIPAIEILDRELVTLIVKVLQLQPGQRVLDLGCGSGIHTLLLAGRGVECVGLDIAPSLMAHATQQAAQARQQNVKYVVGDMRAPAFCQAFDAVIILSASFGFFDEAGNRAVLDGVRRMLRPGGRLLLDLLDPMRFMEARRRVWEELEGGILMFEEWYDPVPGIRYVDFRYLDGDGELNVSAEPEHLRVYTLVELKALLAEAGLKYEATYGSQWSPPIPYSADQRQRMVVVAQA